MKSIVAGPEFEAAYQDIVALLGKHKDNISGIEMLAIASNLVGKLVALQDQRKYTADGIMQIVATNIEAGNAQAIAQLMLSKGQA